MAEKPGRRHSTDTDTNADDKVKIRFDSDANTFYAHYDRECIDSLALAVVRAVSEVRVQEPTNMEPLNTVVDMEALDALLDAGDGSTIEVKFRYEDCRVTVTSDGDIAIKPTRSSVTQRK